MMSMVMVTGSRKWTTNKRIFAVLDELDPLIVVHGGALGADSIAHTWCKKRGRQAWVWFPDWSKGKGAALERNVSMLELGPEIDCAFPMPDSRGTRFTIRKAKEMGIEVRVCEGTP